METYNFYYRIFNGKILYRWLDAIGFFSHPDAGWKVLFFGALSGGHKEQNWVVGGHQKNVDFWRTAIIYFFLQNLNLISWLTLFIFLVKKEVHLYLFKKKKLSYLCQISILTCFLRIFIFFLSRKHLLISNYPIGCVTLIKINK